MNKSSASFWQQRIESVKKNSFYTSWKAVSKAIVERYRSKKSTNNKVDNPSLEKQVGYNLLFRNVKIRMPYLIPYIPNILVERTNKDNDPVARVASTILERAVNKLVSETHLKEKMDLVKLDAELQGFGNLWLRYCPEFKNVPVMQREEITDEDGNIISIEEKEAVDENGNVIEEEKLVSERIEFDYVAPCDFLFNTAKNWNEVEWVARRVYLTKKEFKDQFTDIDITLYDFNEEKDDKDDKTEEKDKSSSCKCEVWEIWDKSDRKIYFYAPFKKGIDNVDDLIAEKDYPFDDIDFPCVKPLMYDEFTDNLIPRPRHAQCWPQYEEVDNITKRISKIIPTIKVAGAVDGSLEGFKKMLSVANEESLVEITNADKYVEKGGIQNAVMWYDVNVPVNVLKTLIEIRKELTEDIQKTIGVYSIIEGQTNSNEAFGTNRLKGAYGTARIQDDQSKIVYYLEDLLILASDI
ncbi:MAG: hypothetical protein K2M23_02380, partial [Alphaproteobacteria bacterium]|nr:hypothetical protein [Alphaproteobacteria bacterium]